MAAVVVAAVAIEAKEMQFPPLRVGFFVGLIVLGFFSVVINSQSHGWGSWYRLAVSGHQAEALITRRQPGRHEACYFEYTVSSVRYEGADQGCPLKIGQRVAITYLPSDPSFATTSSPIKQLAFSVLGPVALSAFGGVMAAWSVSRNRRRRIHAAGSKNT